MLVYQRVMSENPLTGRFIAREHQTSQACLSTWRTFPGFKRICELLSTPWMGKIRSSLMGVDHGEPSTLGFYHQNSQTKLGYNYYQLYIYILYPRNNGWFMISGLPLAGFMGITDYPRWCLRDLLPGSLWHPPDGPSNFNETWKKPQPLIPYFSRLF